MANRALHTLSLFLVLVMLAVGGCAKGKREITRIEPGVGPVEGGHVTIHGNGFLDKGPVGVTVYFGDNKGRVVEVKDDEISVRAPGGKPGNKVDVRLVFDDAREFRFSGGYEYREVNSGFDVNSLTQK